MNRRPTVVLKESKENEGEKRKKEKKPKLIELPSLSVIIALPLALILGSLNRLTALIPGGTMNLLVEPASKPDETTAFDHGNLHFSNTVSIAAQAGDLRPWTLAWLVAASALLTAGVIAATVFFVSGVRRVLTPEFSSDIGFKRLKISFWTLFFTLAAHAICLPTGTSMAIRDLNLEASFPVQESAMKFLWLSIGSLGLIATVRYLLFWGQQARQETENPA